MQRAREHLTRYGAVIGLCAVVLLLGSCQSPVRLSAAPNLFVNSDSYPQADIPQRLRTTDPTVFYVTDRQPLISRGKVVGYDFHRSDSMAFGKAKVSFGGITDWSDLVRRSAGEKHGSLPPLRINAIDELVRFSPTPLPFARQGGRLRTLPKDQKIYAAQMATFKSALAAELRQSPQKEVLVYVHGFKNTFEDSVTTATDLWHFTGRRGVPVAYSWPAGNHGLFKYFKDSESGEFSIFHLKEFLRNLAAMPEVGKINIVAHSRGADVVTSALRELMIFERGAGRDPHKSLKMGVLIMAAPDLDVGVAKQRLVAEHFADVFDQIDVYVNPHDGALGLAQAAATGVRFGRIRQSDFRKDELGSLQRASNVYFINVEHAGGKLGHSYFRKNPGVVSDIILTLRTGAAPGSPERPLDNLTANFWTVHRNYPFARKPKPGPGDNNERLDRP